MNPLTNLNANCKFITPEKVCAAKIQFNFKQYFLFSSFYKRWKSWDRMQNYVTINIVRMLEHENTYTLRIGNCSELQI